MKWICSMSLMAVLLLTGAPAVYALQSGGGAQAENADSRNYREKKERLPEGSGGAVKGRLPEGSGGVILVLAAGAVGGGLLVWRKKRASAA